MKRLIAVLLVMGVIMAAFAANGTEGKMNVTITPTKTAETDVVLNLNQNAGIVWFSAGENQNVSKYILTLPEITVLNQSTSGNSNWVAKGTTDLKLNWNIVSCDKVKIDLIIGGKLTGTDPNNTIGWKVSFKETAYTGNTATPAQTSTTLCAGYPGSSNNLSATAVTKDKSIYGSSGSLLIEEIVTENTYGKNVDNYKATLTAMISTTN